MTVATKVYNAYRLGFAAGQAALKDAGTLVIIDSPELAQLRAELQQSRAETAAAYFIEANDVGDEILLRGQPGKRSAAPNQSAALAAVVSAAYAQGREAGMREAAEMVWMVSTKTNCKLGSLVSLAVLETHTAILAAIPLKGETK